MNRQPFIIQAYGKSELAMLYFPGAAPEVAANRLRRWIIQTKGLLHELRPTGYPSRAHFFSPIQVGIIVKYIGEP